MLSGNTTIAAIPNQVSSELAGEAVILNLASGTYFGLNEVGASVWYCIQQPKTVNQIRDVLLAEYEVEAEQCDRELLALLEDLVTAGLIEVDHEPTA